MAFGGDMNDPFSNGGIKYFNSNFKDLYDWVYYFTTFYVFLNVSSLPVLAIVLRHNFIKLTKINDKKSRNRVFINMLIWGLVFVCCVFLKDKI